MVAGAVVAKMQRHWGLALLLLLRSKKAAIAEGGGDAAALGGAAADAVAEVESDCCWFEVDKILWHRELVPLLLQSRRRRGWAAVDEVMLEVLRCWEWLLPAMKPLSE